MPPFLVQSICIRHSSSSHPARVNQYPQSFIPFSGKF
ncbi:hypothetical protein E2C01_028900 [Portunus trituberculatus]|uniref:Uncharacterized protein n=1 Tax=Portunus trituberculatus TaxID=210409 RepID=A0A5B7EQH3_PORTR|nr:hypothetical protein [Portunus trituberculatus]